MYIECKNIEKTIKGIEILRGISLRMESGKIYGLWGKNGCGKTMLMRVISGLIRPTKGEVDLNGEILWKDISFPRSMGIMIENPSFLKGYTGLENLRLLASIQGKITEEEIRSTIAEVGLDPDDKRKYGKYSLGMKQRLGIACAVMEHPDIIILDEPINALDVGGVAQIQRLCQRLKQEGSLIIAACHDRDEMETLADEIFFMGEGRIERQETIGGSV